MSRTSDAFTIGFSLSVPVLAGALLAAGTVVGDYRSILGWLVVVALRSIMWRSGVRRVSEIDGNSLVMIRLFAIGLLLGAVVSGVKLWLAHAGT